MLSLSEKREVSAFMDVLSNTNPMMAPEVLRFSVESLMKIQKAKKGQELLAQLSNMQPDELDKLSDLLKNWDINDIVNVIDEIDRRILVVEAISRVYEKRETDELHTLHPMVLAARWLFGAEFDSPMFVSNRALNDGSMNDLINDPIKLNEREKKIVEILRREPALTRSGMARPWNGHLYNIPAAEYLKVVPQSKGALQFMINVDKAYLEADEAYVEQYCDVTNQKLDFKSRKMYLKEFKDTVNMFLIVGGVLSAILALIGILNFVNLTYTSIHERKQELKTLWSVGMTKKQIASMLSFEGMLRMGLAFALVLTVGQLLNYYIVYAIAGGTIMFTSHYVIWPMLVCIPVFGVIAALIPRSMVKKIF